MGIKSVPGAIRTGPGQRRSAEPKHPSGSPPVTAPRMNRSVDTTGTSTGTDKNSPLRVLLVEDDRDTEHLIEEMLSAEAAAEDALARFALETRGRLSDGHQRLPE